MVSKESTCLESNLKTGDLVEVITKDGHKFRSIVINNVYNEGFIGRVVRKDEGVGTASWKRYGLNKNSRFQLYDDCKEIKLIAEGKTSKATSALTLNESLTKSEMVYYETPLGNGRYATLCMCEGYGGWSFYEGESNANALKESFFASRISKLNNLESAD